VDPAEGLSALPSEEHDILLLELELLLEVVLLLWLVLPLEYSCGALNIWPSASNDNGL